MTAISMKHYAEYYALRIVAAFVRALPRHWALSFGRSVGRLTMKVLPSRYRMAKENLERALPELNEAEVEAVVYKNFEHLGVSGVEMLRLDMFKHDDLQRYFDVDIVDSISEAMALNRGVILLTGHLGFWEVGHFLLSDLGIPVSVVAKPLKNPLSEKYFTAAREFFGTEIIDSHHGARQIVKTIKENRVVIVLLDQHISPPGSVPTQFFGRPAYTTTAITNLAMKYQVPIVPIFCLRQKDDRYRVWTEPFIMLDKERSVSENTQVLTTIIEKAARKDISQWFWVHKRWRVKKQDKG